VITNLITSAVQLLREGELVAFPTETVYGLGADATNDLAVKKIFLAKGRPSNNPLIAHVKDLSAIRRYGLVPPEHEKTFSQLSALFCPGPLTFVLKRDVDALPTLSPLISAGSDNVAFRIPRHNIALELLQKIDRPIAAPSANPSNYVSPTTAEHVKASLGSKVALIIDGGRCQIGLESTVISLMLGEPPRLLRPGGVSLEELEKVSGEKFEVMASPKSTEQPLNSPGQLAIHYSPKTKLIFRDAGNKSYPAKTGLIEFFPSQHEYAFTAVRTLSEKGDLTEVAHNLFHAVRELDEMGLDLIIVDRCALEGIGRAIMDRLNRAVHK
jgi:L-threonylcarbamoyladenylate synthase